MRKQKRHGAHRAIRGEKSKHSFTFPYVITTVLGSYLFAWGFHLDSAGALLCGTAVVVGSVYMYISIEYRNRARMDRLQEQVRVLSKRKDECDEFIRTYHKKSGAPQMPQQIIRMKTVRIGNGKREVLRDETRVQKKKAV